jgi:ATPase subunit of ABC transporter with duplicated ATPase domains
VLVISHDRFFLDQVADTIWEMDNGFETYHGNYSAYQQQREERRIRLLKEVEATAGIHPERTRIHPAQHGRSEHPAGTGTI